MNKFGAILDSGELLPQYPLATPMQIVIVVVVVLTRRLLTRTGHAHATPAARNDVFLFARWRHVWVEQCGWGHTVGACGGQ